MKRSEFVEKVISTLESLCIEELGECYDITSEAHNLVTMMTVNNEIEWDKEDSE